MKVQIIHLSDIHFENKNQPFEINVDKVIRAISSVGHADECVIVISGDLASKGKYNEYKYVNSLLGAILKNIGQKNFIGRKIEIVCVPGNHDIDFAKMNVTFSDISNAYACGNIVDIFDSYLKNMEGFYRFAKYRNCFLDDMVVSKKVIDYKQTSIGFVMINTAPLSVLGGNAEDMGSHLLSDEQLDKIEHATVADINVLVMHHSIEWFQSSCKEKLRKIISKKYALVLTGHEHAALGESRNINKMGEVQCVQGNALYGYSEQGNGFCAINIDMQTYEMSGYSFIWDKDVYVPHNILESSMRILSNSELRVADEFIKDIENDSCKRSIDDYFVFPSLTYSTFTENQEIKRHEIETEDELYQVVSGYSKVIFNGEHKSGKTILAKRMYKHLYRCGKIPIYINATDINRKKIEKTVEYAFNEQYETVDNAYEKFKQIDKTSKVILLDDASSINKRFFDVLYAYLLKIFGTVIIFSEEKMNLDIRKQVIDAMVEEDVLQINIKPFLYDKRKKLIRKVLLCDAENVQDIEKETNKINELISSQIKYFNLDPEFIINFVKQYEREYRFQFSSGINVFNIVYESSIKNRIIENANNIDATIIMNVLREIAYYMHFNKMRTIKIEKIYAIVEQYNNTYRQNLNVRFFLNASIDAKILVESDNNIYFKDRTLVAYFVAQALNQKYNQDEDIGDVIRYVLVNLCFGINSDIVLFLALITNNPKFINVVIEGAEKHFFNKEELSFDKANVKFLLGTSVQVKNSVPSKKEKEEREAIIARQEEEIKISDLIELADEYDYSDEDLQKKENQILISLKYIELLSKVLPAFCSNMKVTQQDKIVGLIYKCPNQFLYMLLGDIAKDFDDYCDLVYTEVSALRKERKIDEVSIDSVRKIIEQISVNLVIVVYQYVSTICATEQSIMALDAFDYNLNSNYRLQNLMMQSQNSEFGTFARRAQALDKEMGNKLHKSIIKYAVREYLLRNNVEIRGEMQALVDHFFNGKSKNEIKMEIAKRRIVKGKDRT